MEIATIPALLVSVLMTVSALTPVSTYAAVTPPAVTVRELTRHPEGFSGQEVRVQAKVERIEGVGAFTVSGAGFFGGRMLIVVDRRAPEDRDIPVAIRKNHNVELTGKVEEITLTQVEDIYRPLLRPTIRTELTTTSVIPVLLVPPRNIVFTQR